MEGKLTDIFHLTWDMDPVAKGRPRVTRTGHAFTPAKTRKAEQFVKETAIDAMAHWNIPIQEGPLKVEVKVWFKQPKSNKTDWHTQRPDVDNVCKLYLDACNGVVWKDDSQIVELIVKKQWHKYGTVEMTVYTVE